MTRTIWKLKRLNRITDMLDELIGEQAIADTQLLRELGDFYDDYPDDFDWDVVRERSAIARLAYDVVELELAERQNEPVEPNWFSFTLRVLFTICGILGYLIVLMEILKVFVSQ